MPRRREVARREILPDPKYSDRLVSKFINCMMRDGKKSVAEQILYGSLQLIQKRGYEDPLRVFKDAVNNVKPNLEVRSRRVGGANYQVPVEVRPNRQMTLAIRWLVTYARKRGEKTMRERLASELIEANQGRGSSVKKREDTHRMADANKVFAHYRW